MKKLLTLFVAWSFLLASCGQEETNNAQDKDSTSNQQEGIIVDIRETQDGWSQLLIVPNISEEDIYNKKENELIHLAQEKGGAYYSYETSKYKELEVGAHIMVYWNGAQLDSDPPQRGIEKVDVVSR